MNRGQQNRSENQQFGQENTQSQQRGRGLASANPEVRARVASAGGTAVSQDRKHMSEIGRMGGQNSHANRSQGSQGEGSNNR